MPRASKMVIDTVKKIQTGPTWNYQGHPVVVTVDEDRIVEAMWTDGKETLSYKEDDGA